MSEQRKPFNVQMKAFFGLKEGQNAAGFLAELKEITLQDKREFCQMLNQAGYPTEAPAQPKG
jgi:hypothetical protein